VNVSPLSNEYQLVVEIDKGKEESDQEESDTEAEDENSIDPEMFDYSIEGYIESIGMTGQVTIVFN